ncbi:MAG: TonB-dependent siderophore receptor [Neisseriaceae bacterium]|nr:TonB-dependent siderophore receptor [Neisseriaceae bacterium]MBP6862938.1 TonB-dependent siderophore receptor [Neisseriaceae bacterium]
MNPHLLVKPLVLILAMMPMATTALASEDSAELETVVVNGMSNEDLNGRTYGYISNTSNAASKIKTKLNETAQMVSVVTRQQLEDQRPQTISQAMNYSAGAFTGLVGAATRYDYIGMRGFNDNMTDNVLIDGQKLLSDSNTYSSMQIDPYFIERIDMVKGPASATYGRSAPGGVVDATTKRPLHDTYREVNLSGGSDKQRGASFDLTDNLTESGDLAYRLTGLAKLSDSQNEGHESKRFAIAPSLSWHISPQTNLLLQAYIQNDPAAGYHSGLPAAGMINARDGYTFSRGFSDSEPSDYFHRRQNIYSYQFKHAFNDDWRFSSKLRYADVKVRSQQSWHQGWIEGTNQLARGASQADERLKSFAFDNYVEGVFQTGAVQHTVIAGSDYQHRKTKSGGVYATSVPPLDVNHPVYGNFDYDFSDYPSLQNFRLKQLGVYAKDQMKLGRWVVTGGLRHDRVDTSVEDLLTGVTSSDWKGSKTTGQASVLYAFENGLSPFVSYSTGFNPNTYSDQEGKLLGPTTSKQVEAGLKYQQPNTENVYSLALYDLKQEGVANRVVNGNYYIPSGSVKSKGVEFEAKLQVTPQWFTQFALTYNDVKYQNTTTGLDGHTPYQAPRLLASAWTNYRWQNGLDVSAGVRYIDGIWADNENSLKVPAYTLVDLSARYNFGKLMSQLKGLHGSISVNNVFDKKYVASCAGLNYCYYGEGRNVLGNLSYRW